MLIVCTQDETIQRWAQERESGSDQWEPVIVLPKGTQRNANTEFAAAIKTLRANDPLCFSAHGNDAEIGDDGGRKRGWGWNCADIAELLRLYAPENYQGPILCSVCCETVANFSAGLAVALINARACNGVWIYGYNKSVPTDARFPNPTKLSDRPDLQGTQVLYGAEILAKGA